MSQEELLARAIAAVEALAEANETPSCDLAVRKIDVMLQTLLAWREALMDCPREAKRRAHVASLVFRRTVGAAADRMAKGERIDPGAAAGWRDLDDAVNRAADAMLERESIERRVEVMASGWERAVIPEPDAAATRFALESHLRFCGFMLQLLEDVAVEGDGESEEPFRTLDGAVDEFLLFLERVDPEAAPRAREHRAALREAIEHLALVRRGRPREGQRRVPQATAEESLSVFLLKIGRGATPEGLKTSRRRLKTKK